MVKGASKGEGLGNQFLANIREVDAIVHVVRCFEDSNIVHVDGSIDPMRDIETINLELIFSDIEDVGQKNCQRQRDQQGMTRQQLKSWSFWRRSKHIWKMDVLLRTLMILKMRKRKNCSRASIC